MHGAWIKARECSDANGTLTLSLTRRGHGTKRFKYKADRRYDRQRLAMISRAGLVPHHRVLLAVFTPQIRVIFLEGVVFTCLNFYMENA